MTARVLRRAAALAVIAASAAFGQYTWDYAKNPVIQDATRWSANGGSNISYPAMGVTFGGSGGSLISIPSISGSNPSDYEVQSTLSLKSGGGTYIHFLRANSLTVQSGSGSYVSVEIVPNGWMNIKQATNGTVTTLGGTSVSTTDGMTLRTIIFGANLWVFINNVQVWTGTVTQTTGNPGIGGYSMPTGNGFSSIKLGQHDTVAPNAITQTNFHWMGGSYTVAMQWQGVADDPNGIGVWAYRVNGPYFNTTTTIPTIAVYGHQTVTGTIVAIDYHGNASAPFSYTGSTLAFGLDARRAGVMTIGSYYGAGGEQIDTRSGNLNLSLPLLAPQGRTGWTVPVNLSYNSQNWKQANGANWELGWDGGAGFGWSLSIGSLMPYNSNFNSGTDHYVYTDASGAQYQLTGNGGNIWSSTQSSYIWYDSTANIVHFKSGAFWVMGCVSGGTEIDAGALYPTVIEDPNGNQVLVTYATGAGLPAGTPNSSSRIATIQDVRGMGAASYSVNWNNGVLASIANTIGTNEAYTFTFPPNSASLTPPFGADGHNWGTANLLKSIILPTGASWNFTYDPSGSGELTQATYPDGGHIRWAYGTATYTSQSGNWLLREISTRYVANTAGATEWGPYTFTHDDSQNPSLRIHANTTMADASGIGARTWDFYLPQGSSQDGLATDYFETATAGGTVLSHDVYTWTTDPNGYPYIGTKQTTLDPGSANPQTTQTTQTLDQYGNVTQAKIYDYNSLTTPIRTYNNTWLHTSNSNYANAYIRNRLLSSSVTDNNTHTVTLATNTYDFGTLAAVSPTPYEFDTVQGATTNTIRGNVTQTVAMIVATNYAYDQTGNALSGSNASGTGASATYSPTTNFTVPATAAPMAGSPDVQNGHTTTQAPPSQLTTILGYNTALSLISSAMPNSATAGQTFNSSNGLLTSSTSVHGAITAYAYVFNPTTVTATTTNSPTLSHWSKAYKDGFGRDLAIETGTGSTIVSHTANTYGPCACSPLGKVTQTSQPYAIGSGGQITATDGTINIAWTTYVYDGRGRTVTETMPDNSIMTYYYLGNTTKMTDSAGNWKRYTSDTLGNLTKVEEPNPVNGQADNPSTNFVTNYSYDVEAHLIQVQMPRGAYTQTRTFTYDLTTGHLLSTTNPESGTVTYAYYSSGRMLSKTDAKGQKVVYSYDGYGRTDYIDRYPDGVTWDQCHSVALTYDASLNGSNLLGRIATATTGNLTACASDLAEGYSYSPGGLVTAKGYNINIPTACYGYQCSNEYFTYGYGPSATFTYDNEGHPAGYNTFAYSLDAMGRPTSLTETGPNTAWVQNAAYGPGGEMTTMQFRTSAGSYYTETHTFNNRAQLTELQTTGTGLTGMDLQYIYPSGNNGQILQMTDAISGEHVTYTYDSLKRLIKAETTQLGGLQWGQSFGYDDFGNLTTKTATTGHTGTAMSLSIDQNTNHVTMSGFAYDANGNMTSIPSTPQNISLTYDTENRTGGTWYDQQNQPLDRTGAPGVWYLYGLNGERMGTYTYSVSWTQYPNPNGTGYVYLATVTQTQVSRNIYFGGHLIQSNGTTVVLDRLGSVRANENGETFEYYPYGEEITIKNPQDREKFGMYTRESSTGLDYADQRYYSSIYGQFGRSDMGAGSTPQSPLTWNGYRYATGDPINAGDPTGLYGCGLVFADEGDESDAGLGCFAAKPGSVDFVYPTKYYTPCPPYGIALSFLPGQGCAALIEAAADNSRPARKLSSNDPQCLALARKIANITQDIVKRELEIHINALNLPEYAPGPLRDSIDGHQLIVDDLKDILAKRTKEYNDLCNPPPPMTPVTPVPNLPGYQAPSTPGSGPSILFGIGLALTCGFFPELCAVVAPIIIP